MLWSATIVTRARSTPISDSVFSAVRRAVYSLSTTNSRMSKTRAPIGSSLSSTPSNSAVPSRRNLLPVSERAFLLVSQWPKELRRPAISVPSRSGRSCPSPSIPRRTGVSGDRCWDWCRWGRALTSNHHRPELVRGAAAAGADELSGAETNRRERSESSRLFDHLRNHLRNRRGPSYATDH